MQAALAGGKAKKKKWNKGKMREKINAKVLFDEDGWNRLQAEVPKVRHSRSENYSILREIGLQYDALLDWSFVLDSYQDERNRLQAEMRLTYARYSHEAVRQPVRLSNFLSLVFKLRSMYDDGCLTT